MLLFIKHESAYEMRISVGSSYVCSSDIRTPSGFPAGAGAKPKAAGAGHDGQEGPSKAHSFLDAAHGPANETWALVLLVELLSLLWSTRVRLPHSFEGTELSAFDIQIVPVSQPFGLLFRPERRNEQIGPDCSHGRGCLRHSAIADRLTLQLVIVVGCDRHARLRIFLTQGLRHQLQIAGVEGDHNRQR